MASDRFLGLESFAFYLLSLKFVGLIVSALDRSVVRILIAAVIVFPAFTVSLRAAPISCNDLQSRYEKILAYETDLSIYRFLQEHSNQFQTYPTFKTLAERKKKLKYHRESPEAQKFEQTCDAERPLILDTEKQFCQDFRTQDQALLDAYNDAYEAFAADADVAIAADVDFVALGESGRPLAANVQEFSDAFVHYKRKTATYETDIARGRKSLENIMNEYPELKAECGHLLD